MKYTHDSHNLHNRNTVARFVPILLVVVITVIAVAAIISIGQTLMGGDDARKNTSSKEDAGKTALLSTSANRSVRLTVRGPIVAEEKFRSYEVTVSPDSRSMTTYEGYLDKQLTHKKLSNNYRAYEEFVYALDKRKMMDGKQLNDQQNDLRGICASGKVYMFETLLDGEEVKTLWTSDCGGSKGSAQANVQEVLEMFLKQIPDGSKMASQVGLNQEGSFLKL